MTKLCPRGKAAAKRKFKVYPSAYANAYASKICAGKIKDPSGVKRKDFKGPKPAGARKGKMISRREELIKKQNPHSEYDKKGKLKYTAAKKGSMMIIIGIGKKKKADKKMGGGLAAATEKLKAKGLKKGGGADTGTIGEERSKIGVEVNKLTRRVKDMPLGTKGRKEALKRIKRLGEEAMRRGNIKRSLASAKDFQKGRRELFKGTAGKNIRLFNKGGDAKIKKVITGLNKASALHKGQAKSLQSIVKKSKGGGADYMNTVKARKRGNPGITEPKPKSLKEKNKLSGGGMARGSGAAIRGNKFQGIF